MGIFPITPLVRQVQSLILETFQVSEQDAENIAAEMVALEDGWGSPETATNLDWSYRIRKDLGETKKLRWKSEEERAEFEAAQRLKYAEWDAIINRRKGV